MIFNVIAVNSLFLSIFKTSDYATDTSFAGGSWAERAGIRQQSLEKLNRNDFLSLKLNFINASHTNVAQHF